jgi:Na+/H+-translocating membrane pyrophosphatase
VASSSVASSSAASDSSSEASNVSLRAGHGALLALSGLALLVLVVVTFIVLRARSE